MPNARPKAHILLGLVLTRTTAYREINAKLGTSLTNLGHHYTHETCGNYVAGALRQKGWGRTGCKCPDGSVVVGKSTSDCQDVRGTRYFTFDQLESGKCYCEQDTSRSCLKVIPDVGCRFMHCRGWRNATCEDAKCTCAPGFCSVSGVCVHEASPLVQPALGPMPFKMRINRAQLNRSTTYILPQEPYVRGILGAKRFKSIISEAGGHHHPIWRYDYHNVWEGEHFLYLKVMERSHIKEELIGAGALDMAQAYEDRADSAVYSIHLQYKGAHAGVLSVSVQWKVYVLVRAQSHCQAKNQSMLDVHSVRECAEVVRHSGGFFFATAQVYENKTAMYPCYKVETATADCEGKWLPGNLNFYTLDVGHLHKSRDTCERRTSSPCKWRFSSCRQFGSAATCTNGKCKCRIGFCLRDGKCKPNCVDSPTVSATDQALIDFNLKSLKDGSLKERAEALQHLGKFKLVAATHAHVVAHYLDFGFTIRLNERLKRWLGSKPTDELYWGAEYSASGMIGGGANFLTSAGIRYSVLAELFGGLSIGAGAFVLTPELLIAGGMGWLFQHVSHLILNKKFKARAAANAAIRANATEALSYMGKCGERYGRQIALRLGDSFSSVRMEALNALQRMPRVGAKYIGEIAVLLNDPEYSIRNKAMNVITVLGEAENVYAADEVASMLIIDKPLIQLLAIRSLGMLGVSAGRHVMKVVPFLRSTELSMKQAAAQSLSQMGPAVAAAKEKLIEVLRGKNEDELVRGLVAATLKNHLPDNAENKQYLSEVELLFPEGGGLPPVVSQKTAADALKRYLQESRARVVAEQKQREAELELNEAMKKIQLLTRIESEQSYVQLQQKTRSLAHIGRSTLSYLIILSAIAVSWP